MQYRISTTDMEQTTAITTTSAQALLQAQNITADEVVNMFLQQHDAADSSIALYGRALRQFFAWVQRTGRRTELLTRADIWTL